MADSTGSPNSALTYGAFIAENLSRTVNLRAYKNVRVRNDAGTVFNVMHSAVSGDLFLLQRGPFNLQACVIALGTCTRQEADAFASDLWATANPADRVVGLQQAIHKAGERFTAADDLDMGLSPSAPLTHPA